MTNVLPQPVAPQSSVQVSNPAALLSTLSDRAAAGRQQLAVAVVATGASAAFSPNTQPQRQQLSTNRSAPAPAQATILPDHALWKPELRMDPKIPLPLPPRMEPQINLPQISQFTAQRIAQQLPEEAQEETAPPIQLRRNLPGKKPSVGEARGANAYQVAVERNMTMTFPTSVEEVF